MSQLHGTCPVLYHPDSPTFQCNQTTEPSIPWSCFPSPSHLCFMSLVSISPTSQRVLRGQVGYPATQQSYRKPPLSLPLVRIHHDRAHHTGIWRASPGRLAETKRVEQKWTEQRHCDILLGVARLQTVPRPHGCSRVAELSPARRNKEGEVLMWEASCHKSSFKGTSDGWSGLAPGAREFFAALTAMHGKPPRWARHRKVTHSPARKPGAVCMHSPARASAMKLRF